MRDSKDKKKKRERTASPLARVLASASDQRIVLKRYFENLTTSQIRYSFSHIANHRHFCAAAFTRRPTPLTFYKRTTPVTTFQRNIAWCLGVIEFHAEKINKIVALDAEITSAILRQDLDHVLELLEQVDAENGLTMWSLSLRGAVLTSKGALEEKRALLTRLHDEAQTNRFFKAVLYLKLNRQDEADILSGESRYFEQKVRRTFKGDILHFIMYKVVQNNFEFDLDFARVLAIEKNSSPYDIFLVLQDFIIYSRFSETSLIYPVEVNLVINALAKSISGPTVCALARIHGLYSEWGLRDEELSLIDLYTAGKYDEVCTQLLNKEALVEKFAIFEIWAKSAARVFIYPEGYLGKLLKATVSILLKDDQHDVSSAFLLAQCEAFGSLAWFRELYFFLIKETRFIGREKNRDISWVSAAISTVDSPFKMQVMAEEAAESFSETLAKMPKAYLVGRFFNAIRSGSTEITDFPAEVPLARVSKFLALANIAQNDDENAVKILRTLADTSDTLIANDAARELVGAYIRLGQLELAIERYVRTVLHNPALLRTYDNQIIAVACESLLGKSPSIAIPIALSLYSRFIGDSYDAALRYAFEVFLLNQEVNTPDELLKKEIDRDLLFYFLEYVAVPAVMKLYLYFENTREIEEARVTVCKLLADNGHNVEAMVSEVKERTRQLVIRAGAKHVENSRIYSDTRAFTKPETSILYRQLFDRFVQLSRNDYSNTQDEITLKKFLSNFEVGSVVARHAYKVHLQDMVLNEKNATFLKLVKLMRDDFTFGERGLSGYLSTRIRHGHLPNAFRKSVSDEGLICSRLLPSGTYKDDAPWLKSIVEVVPSTTSDLAKNFVDFSSRFDGLVDEVNDVWLQIFTVDQDISGLTSVDEVKKNLFDYSVTALEAYYLQQQLQPVPEYNDFVKVVIQWLWDRTENNLLTIRENIAGEVRNRAIAILENFSKSALHTVGDSADLTQFLDSLSRARVALNGAIDTVVAWFTRSQGLTPRSFESVVPVEIARLSCGVPVSSHEDETGLLFEGRTMSYFVDFLYVLLDNCLTKSGFQHAVVIDTSFTVEDDQLKIKVTNNCLPVSSVEEANNSLQFYREHYGKESYALIAAQGEGGSGLFKVWKALRKDLELSHSIRFGYLTDTKFQVEISIQLNELQKVLHYENSIG